MLQTLKLYIQNWKMEKNVKNDSTPNSLYNTNTFNSVQKVSQKISNGLAYNTFFCIHILLNDH